MRCKIYGMFAAAPVDFPNEVELRIYPHDKETSLASGGFYPYIEHRSWEWVRSRVPLVEYAWANIEQELRGGNCAALHLGEHSIDLPDGAEGPGILQEEAPKEDMA